MARACADGNWQGEVRGQGEGHAEAERMMSIPDGVRESRVLGARIHPRRAACKRREQDG